MCPFLFYLIFARSPSYWLMLKYLVLLIILFTAPIIGRSQTAADSARAQELYEQGAKLVDDGKFDEGIEVYRSAEKILPNTFMFPYEIAYAELLRKDYKKAIELIRPIVNHPEATDRGYQLLGSAYDELDDSTKAYEAYTEGLTHFAKSGRLYLERGILQARRDNISGAMKDFEAGIEKAPSFPSNYYYAALECSSNHKIWSLIYGEIFMNLEPNTKRTQTISKLLYDVYKDGIKLKGDTTVLSLAPDPAVVIDDNTNVTLQRFPFEEAVAIKIFFSFKEQKTRKLPDGLDLQSMLDIRKEFLNRWYAEGTDSSILNKGNKDFPVALFDWDKQVRDAGFEDQYNLWLLCVGNAEEAKSLVTQNQEKFTQFFNWFKDHRYTPIESRPLFRAKYPMTKSPIGSNPLQK